MSAATSPFNWRGKPSIFPHTKHQGNAIPAKDHPLRNKKTTPEARKVGSKSRAPTANINTERA